MNYLIKLCEYNVWANGEIVGFMRKAGPQAYNLEQQSSFPTLLKTLYHIWDAQHIWLLRLDGKSISDWPSKSFAGTAEQGFQGFMENSKALKNFVLNLEEPDFKEEITYTNTKGEAFVSSLGDMVLHCMNHSTYHRGQMITMLRNAGFTDVSSTDYIHFMRTQFKQNTLSST